MSKKAFSLTHHAKARILERTKLSPHAVHFIFMNKLGILLGSAGKTLFYCFYSVPDKKAKIMVAYERGSTRGVVSIWETYFDLPPGVTPPTEEICEAAKKLQYDWLSVNGYRITEEGRLILPGALGNLHK